MNINLIAVVCFLLAVSCAQVNTPSRDYYQAKTVRHGIVPLTKAKPIVSEKDAINSRLDEAAVARGKKLYEANCLSCHGEKGRGDGPHATRQKHAPANLQAMAEEVSNFDFYMSISEWQGDMPGWKEPYNEAQRSDLASYIKTFKHQ